MGKITIIIQNIKQTGVTWQLSPSEKLTKSIVLDAKIFFVAKIKLVFSILDPSILDPSTPKLLRYYPDGMIFLPSRKLIKNFDLLLNPSSTTKNNLKFLFDEPITQTTDKTLENFIDSMKEAEITNQADAFESLDDTFINIDKKGSSFLLTSFRPGHTLILEK